MSERARHIKVDVLQTGEARYKLVYLHIPKRCGALGSGRNQTQAQLPRQYQKPQKLAFIKSSAQSWALGVLGPLGPIIWGSSLSLLYNDTNRSEEFGMPLYTDNLPCFTLQPKNEYRHTVLLDLLDIPFESIGKRDTELSVLVLTSWWHPTEFRQQHPLGKT